MFSLGHSHQVERPTSRSEVHSVLLDPVLCWPLLLSVSANAGQDHIFADAVNYLAAKRAVFAFSMAHLFQTLQVLKQLLNY
ncbi:MAG: hypothetical protein J2P37_29415 [Ktedonobacteraceae bacterium]|nr:hypothetical protein [Ktedonobacteraceae bacterium]